MRGLPVVVTVRLDAEGGKWKQPDELRLPLFEAALRHLAAADIELRSPILEQVSALARRYKRALIVSHHDFGRTPPLEELRVIVDKASRYGTVAKVATMVRTEEDLAILRALLAEETSHAAVRARDGTAWSADAHRFPKARLVSDVRLPRYACRARPGVRPRADATVIRPMMGQAGSGANRCAAIWQYFLETSTWMKCRPVFFATTATVPVPPNGSRTTLPR